MMQSVYYLTAWEKLTYKHGQQLMRRVGLQNSQRDLYYLCWSNTSTRQTYNNLLKFIEWGHIDSVIPITTTVVKYCPKVSTDCEPVQEVFHNSTITKEVAEILLPMEVNKDPHFILFEGAPGMGKTLLLKKIAYNWGKRQILQKLKFIIL